MSGPGAPPLFESSGRFFGLALALAWAVGVCLVSITDEAISSALAPVRRRETVLGRTVMAIIAFNSSGSVKRDL